MYCWWAPNSFAICSLRATAKDFSAMRAPGRRWSQGRRYRNAAVPRSRPYSLPLSVQPMGGRVREIREEKAWLLRSRINPLPISGALELAGGRISFRLDGMAAEARLDWLEEQLAADGLRARIQAGEDVVAFDYPLDDCEIS